MLGILPGAVRYIGIVFSRTGATICLANAAAGVVASGTSTYPPGYRWHRHGWLTPASSSPLSPWARRTSGPSTGSASACPPQFHQRDGFAPVDFLEQAADDEPFCLLVHHKAPHRPWVPHPRYDHLYTEGTIPEPETMWDDHASMSDVVQQARMTLDDLTLTDIKEPVPPELEGEDRLRERSSWKYQRYMRDYLRTVQAVDDSVGTLLDWVDAHGRRDNTVVIYTSDQGFFLGDHGWFDKRLMFDESLTMPLPVRWPAAIEAGQQVDSIITNVDFAATFLDMCGFEPDELPQQQGRSFLPHLRGQSVEDWPESLYYRYWEHDDPEHHAPAHYGVRTRRYKYIHYYNDGLDTPGSSDRVLPSEYELYDLEKDPSELRNVVDVLAYAEVRAEMEAELARLQEKYRDQPYQGPDTPRLDWAV